MRKILVCSASRAEYGLLFPVMMEFDKRDDIEAEWFRFNYIHDSIPIVLTNFEKHLKKFEPDIVLVPTDRWEAVHIACHCFNKGYIISHFHAGDIGEYTTDGMNRFAISFMSHILLCNSDGSKNNLLKLGFEDFRIFVVGTTALDNIILDESLCPKEPFLLVLLHPDPVSMKATYRDLKETVNAVKKRNNPNVIWLRPNKDNNHEIIDNFLDNIEYNVELIPYINHITVYADLPRPQYLGLLKNCVEAIGNSSSFALELPLISPETHWIKIGQRNLHRTPPSDIFGASKRIAEILATIQIDEKLRRKKLIL